MTQTFICFLSGLLLGVFSSIVPKSVSMISAFVMFIFLSVVFEGNVTKK